MPAGFYNNSGRHKQNLAAVKDSPKQRGLAPVAKDEIPGGSLFILKRVADLAQPERS